MAFPPGSFSITSGPWAGGLFSWSPTRGPSPPWWGNCSGRALGPLPQRAPSRGCGPPSPTERTGRCPGRRWRRCPPGNCLWPRFIRPIAGCSGSGAGWTMTIRWCTRRRFSGGMGRFWPTFRKNTPISVWMRPRIPPAFSIPFSACWREGGETSFWWGMRTRASMGFGRRNLGLCCGLSGITPAGGSFSWRRITAPPRPL